MEGVRTEEFFVEAKDFFQNYKTAIGKAARSGEGVVLVNFEDLASFSPNISELLLEKPEEVLGALESALLEMKIVKNPRIRILDLPKDNFIKIRNIRAKHLNRFIWRK